MTLIIDNYDSFTYNLLQFCGSADPNVRVVRNDSVTVEDVLGINPRRIILSPGPGYPKDAGVCEELVRRLKDKYPILGVCLGHQAICEVFGARITHASELMHGKSSIISIDNTCEIFKGLPQRVQGARYHSLIAERSSVPSCLNIIAQDDTGEVMGVKHRDYQVYGLQFHPESILTAQGMTMIKNFINEVHI